MSLQALLDRVVTEAAAHAGELVAAREEWDARTGKVFDDDPLYEERTAAFLEWYVLERGAEAGPTFVERALHAATDGDRQGLTLLSRTHRSLFLVREIDGGPAILVIGDVVSHSAPWRNATFNQWISELQVAAE